MKLQGSVSKISLQIDMQNFVSTESDLLATKKKKKRKIIIIIIFTKIRGTRFCHRSDDITSP